MNKLNKEVMEYWHRRNACYIFDPETLDLAVSTLTEEEKLILGKGVDTCKLDPDLRSRFMFVANKAFNRHNDIISGYTILEDDEISCTEKSSITELQISPETLVDCNRNCIYHIADVEKTILPSLSLEAIADLTAAIILYNTEHGVPIEV